METKRETSSDGVNAQVGVLLDRVHESTSIVDSLMAMPLPGESDAAPEWDAAVTRRLERKLADAMRSMLDSNELESSKRA